MKYILTLFTVFMVLGATAQVPSYVPTDSLKAWYPFNGNANDNTSNANHETVSGATLTKGKDNITNTAFIFDGINDFISINDPFNNNDLQFIYLG